MLDSKLRKSILSIAMTGACAILAGAASQSAVAGVEMTRVIVKYKAGHASHIKSHALSARGAVKHEIFGEDAMAIEVPKAALQGLSKAFGVEYIEPDHQLRLHSLATPSTGAPYLSGQLVPYGIQMVQADQLPAGDAHTGSRKVCVIDSGIDSQHEDLRDNNMTGYSFLSGFNWSTDEAHHGTHVAGTIAAVNNSGVGVVGINPNKKIQLFVAKVSNVDGISSNSHVLSAVNRCVAAGANVINLSLGGAPYSQTADNTYSKAAKNGVLVIASAGNDGDNRYNYPASYSSVMSVASIDQNMVRANSSNFNDQIDIAAPGVGVLSSVPMNTGYDPRLTVGGTAFAANALDRSAHHNVSAPLADFGTGDAINTAVAGKVCLIQRGGSTFATKVGNCRQSGGVGAIVYNNASGLFGGYISGSSPIPAFAVSDTDGAILKGRLGQTASLVPGSTSYMYWDGTSMAAPHVSGVAALVWSYFPSCTAAQIRSTLIKSAKDLGAAGWDAYYGYGLVRAKAAYDRIQTWGCSN